MHIGSLGSESSAARDPVDEENWERDITSRGRVCM